MNIQAFQSGPLKDKCSECTFELRKVNETSWETNNASCQAQNEAGCTYFYSFESSEGKENYLFQIIDSILTLYTHFVMNLHFPLNYIIHNKSSFFRHRNSSFSPCSKWRKRRMLKEYKNTYDGHSNSSSFIVCLVIGYSIWLYLLHQ